MAKAFAEPTRVRVLSALQQGELCVCELCDALNVPQSTLSTHLQVIRDAGLVRTRKEGKWIYYALNGKKTSLTGAVFKLFAPNLTEDKMIARDRKRLRARLACRQAGECCVGFRASAPAKRKKGKQ